MIVEELLNSKRLDYRQKGKDYLIKCLNPDHDDSDPSLRIDKITGVMHCLSCGFKGNIFKFFGEKANSFQIRRERLKQKIALKLSDSIGLEIPLGSVPYDGDWRDISPATYAKFGAFVNPAPEYIGRIIFPVTGIDQRIIGFIGRHQTLTHNPRYMIYPAGSKLPFFPQVKPIQGKIIIVEGIFDMLNLHDKGLTNAVTVFGTRNVTEAKLEILKIQGIDGIDVFFDGDEPGQKASEDVKVLCEKVELSYRNIKLNDNDPGSLSPQAVDNIKEKLYG